ncbi:MAG: hypothetical protein D6675_00085 [Gemmatimonadetes bacterium]|nr:MAG: hypothetical protein D6675_00085 [Gemmatimonadota bacterium]
MKFDQLPILGAVVAAVAASSCCILPLAVTLLGFGSVGFASVIEPYRPLFVGLTIGLFLTAFYIVYRKPKNADSCGCHTKTASKTHQLNKILLWVLAPVIIGLVTFPYYSGAFVRPVDTVESNLSFAQVTLSVEGMTCAGCVAHVQHALIEIDGVQSAVVDLAHKQATVTYDDRHVHPAELVEAIAKAGYSAKVLTDKGD